MSAIRSFRGRRPSPAMVVAFTALVVALGGTSYAALVVTGASIRNNTVASIDLADNSILSRDIRNGSIYPIDLSAAAKRSMQGEPGPAGAAGADGATGATGPAGPAGIVGNEFASDSSLQSLTESVGTSGTLVESVVISTDAPSRLLVLGTVEATDNGSADTRFRAQCVSSVYNVATTTNTVLGSPVTVEGADSDYLVSTIQARATVTAGAYSVQLYCWDSATHDAEVNRAALQVLAVAT